MDGEDSNGRYTIHVCVRTLSTTLSQSAGGRVILHDKHILGSAFGPMEPTRSQHKVFSVLYLFHFFSLNI